MRALAVLGFVVLVTVMVVADVDFARRHRQTTADLLVQMAESQARGIAAYMRERLGDATLTASSPGVQRVLAGELGARDAVRERAALSARLRQTAAIYGYHNIQVFDLDLNAAVAVGHDEARLPRLRAYLREAMERRAPRIVPMQFDANGDLEFGVVVPVVEADVARPRVLGAVYLALLADSGRLADLREGTPSAGSRDVSVVQAAGDSVFVLHALHDASSVHQSEARQVPRDSNTVVSLALAGPTSAGTMLQAMGLRGVPVYGATVRVPGTPWHVVASIDVAEVEQRIWAMRGLRVLRVAFLTGMMVLLLRAAAARRREELAAVSTMVGLRAVRVVQTSLDGYIAMDREGRVLEANESVGRMIGYTPDEMRRLTIADLRINAGPDEGQAMLSRLEGGEGVQYRCLWRRKDGTPLDLDVSARYLEEEGGGRIVAFLRDVTEELKVQRRLERSSHLYSLLNRANGALFDARTESEACAALCDAIVADGEFRLAWVASVADGGTRLHPVASAGVASQCVSDLFRMMGDDAGLIRGPQRAAIDSGAPHVINDFMASADAAPWHGLAARHGIQSVAILPVRRDGECRHLLLVYHSERGYFEPDLVSLVTELARFLGAVLAAREAADTQRKEEARFQALFEASPLPMVVFDDDGRHVLRVNRVFSSVFGYSAQDFSDLQTMQERLYPDPELRRIVATQFDGIVQQLTPLSPASETPATVIACASGETRYAQALVTHIGHELLVAYADLTSLRRSEARAAEAQEIAQLVSWEYDFATQHLIDPDSQMRRHLVRDGAMLSLFDVVIPDDREMVKAAMQRAVTQRTPLDVTARLEMQDGQIRYHRGRMRIEYDAAGQPVRGIGSSQDVTDSVVLQRELEAHRNHLQVLVEARTAELEKAVAQLQRTDRRLTAMFRLSKLAPTLHESDLVQQAVDEAERLTGSGVGYLQLLREDGVAVESCRWSTQVCTAHPAAALATEIAPSLLSDALRTRQPVRHHALDADGGSALRDALPVALRRHLVVPLVEHGRVVLLLGVGNKDAAYTDEDAQELELVARDVWSILERRRTEVALERAYEQVAASDARFAFALEASSEGIWDWDLVSGQMTFSREYVKILGFDANEMPENGREWGLLVHPVDRDRVVSQTLAELKSDAPGLQEFRIRRKNGTYIWVQKWGRVVARDARGYALRVVGTLSDLTARRNAEEELRAAKEAADEANRAKSAFLAVMSHEIRTPLNGVMGMADVLAQSALPAREAEAVKTIRTSAATLLTLIDDILDFSKIDAGRLELEILETDLEELAETVVATLRPVAQTRYVELSLFLSPALPRHVMSDSVRLRQVVFNLLGNAVKFGAGCLERSGRVMLRLEPCADEPLCLQITVRDDGIGIGPEAQARLFETFSQAETSTTRRFGGTGLGLAITKRLTELMGGTISVRSALGEGATFIVRIPVTASAQQRDVSMPDLRGVTALIVPSDRDFGEADDVSEYLAHAGVVVRRCRSLSDACTEAAPLDAAVVVDWAVHQNGDGLAVDATRSVRRLQITGGRGHGAPAIEGDRVTVDGAALTLRRFLHAFAVAAGRASPVVPSKAPDDDVAAPASPPMTVAEARAAGRLILVAEDDDVNQRVILRQLELLGYAAELAADGAEALRLWSSGTYAMLLTDVHMPVMDGYALTEAIRAQETDGRRAPIVALTANALRGEESRARASGMDGYLTKPLRLMDLKRELQARLHPEGGPSDTSVPPTAAEAVQRLGVAVDVSVLQRFIGDDPELVNEFLHEYRKSATLHMGALNRAMAEENIAQIGMTAHTLKSSSRAAGATQFGDLLAELEAAAKRHDVAAVAQYVAAVTAEYERVVQALRTLAPEA